MHNAVLNGLFKPHNYNQTFIIQTWYDALYPRRDKWRNVLINTVGSAPQSPWRRPAPNNLNCSVFQDALVHLVELLLQHRERTIDRTSTWSKSRYNYINQVLYIYGAWDHCELVFILILVLKGGTSPYCRPKSLNNK